MKAKPPTPGVRPVLSDAAGEPPLHRLLRPAGARRDGQASSALATPRQTATTLWLLGLDPRGARPGPGDASDGAPEHAARALLQGIVRAGRPSAAPSPFRHHLTRQITLTDLCQPDADRAGAVILALRHPSDFPPLARQHAPPGRRVEWLGEAWGRVLEASTMGSCRAESGCTRAGLVSLNFLVAACAPAYDAREAAEAVRTHVTANYRGARTGARLDALAECLRAMVHTHVFPHEAMRFFGSLASWVTQDELASVTAVCGGPHEGARTGNPGRPRSAITVPACAFIDLDAELCFGRPGAAFLYLAFTYRQRRDQELCCVYVIKSQLPPRGLESALERLFGRLRTTNTIHGIEDMAPPPPDRNADFPLAALAADPRAPRCSAGQVEAPQYAARLYRWRPDLRGRPTARTCAYAAFAELGVMPDDTPRCMRHTERFGSVSVPVVLLEGVVWRPGEWRVCS
ncbi:capsid triplex subunit 1 [Macacine alphaherpesvirus 1]|nr:capsid triplex subunit 1 [Macacine alphaherpesvirus 1]